MERCLKQSSHSLHSKNVNKEKEKEKETFQENKNLIDIENENENYGVFHILGKFFSNKSIYLLIIIRN